MDGSQLQDPARDAGHVDRREQAEGNRAAVDDLQSCVKNW